MRKFASFIGLLLPFCLFGQQIVTAHLLPEIEIQSARLSEFSTGTKVERIDSSLRELRPGSTLAALLSEGSNAGIRTYGTGGLATLSFRGTQTTESAVFWNGFNLNQPNMGMTDLSHIPSLFFNDVSLQLGGGSALFGSGLIGGSLHLANSPLFSSSSTSNILFSAGSFGDYTTAARMSYGNRKLAWSGALFANSDQNNYPYTDLSGQEKTLDHARGSSAGIIQQLSFRISPRELISASFWWQGSEQEIPATLVMSFSDQKQSEKAFRSSLQWMHQTARQGVKLRFAYFDEQLHYSSPVALIDALYHLRTLAVESEYQFSAGKNTEINTGASARYLLADVPYYEGMRTQVEAALFASLLHRWSPAGWKTIINLRQDLVQGYQIPFCPSLGTEGNLAKNLRLRFSVSRNFRVPTMNDRFWQPGGNPSVLPESSWNQEAGLDLAVSGRNQSLRGVISVTLYNLLIHNLIQWVSITPSVWSPRNVQQVWSRGAEASFKVYYQIVPVSGYFQLLYNYSPSTYSQPQTAGDESAGRQLIYIPLHKFNTAFSVNVHKFYGFLNTLVTGIRFVQKDNSKSLPAYSLTNLTLGYRFQGRASGCRLQFEIRNLFNTQFQSVQYYPEPGRSFQLNLLISLKLKTQS